MIPDSHALRGAYNTSASAPQDFDTEVRPVERALQGIDPNLRIVWNPKAFLARPGHYDAEGRPVPPTYDGRWHVVIQGKLDGVDTVVYTLGSEDGSQKPYKPVGPWLVDYMREWDTANVHRMAALRKLQDEEVSIQSALAQHAHDARAEAAARFSTDVLGLKPIRSVVPAHLS